LPKVPTCDCHVDYLNSCTAKANGKNYVYNIVVRSNNYDKE